MNYLDGATEFLRRMNVQADRDAEKNKIFNERNGIKYSCGCIELPPQTNPDIYNISTKDTTVVIVNYPCREHKRLNKVKE